jgi:hypothetical protein
VSVRYGKRYASFINPRTVRAVEFVRGLGFSATERTFDAMEQDLDRPDGAHWADPTGPEHRYVAAADRYWLLTRVLGRTDMRHPWVFDRVREVEAEPDECLDLWSREHYKSSIITQGGIIQEIINDPEITIGIFSFNRPTAQAFLRQIQRELETNETLKTLFPDIFWQEPRREAQQWAQDKGLVVKRVTNPKEATVEAWGLVEGAPTSKHFRLRVYDDIVTRESVTTPEMIRKVTSAWELSDNLGAVDPETGTYRRWHAGTRYHFGDTYGIMIERQMLKTRVYPATDDGTKDGRPVLWSPEVWAAKKQTQRSTMAAQLLLNPLGGAERVFDPSWFKGYQVIPANLNVYIMIDPSRGRTKSSDRTAMAVVGVTEGGTKYLLDGVRHRMGLFERWERMRDFYKRWSKHPGVQAISVGYERFGQTSDDEYFQERMRHEKISFELKELAWPREGSASKQHRIERLEPEFRMGRFLLPALVHHQPTGGTCLWSVNASGHMEYRRLEGETRLQRDMRARGLGIRCVQPIRRKDEEGIPYDVTLALLEELLFFPVAPKDDLADATSRIYDMEPTAPVNYAVERKYIETPSFEDA